MNKSFRYPITLLALTLSATAFSQATQDEAKSETSDIRYSMKEDAPTGSRINFESVKGSRIPFNKRYQELSPEEKQVLKKQYPNLAENDEPPFPLNGLGPLYKNIAAGQNKLLIDGLLRIDLEIDETGEAVSASVIQSPSKDTTQYCSFNEFYAKLMPFFRKERIWREPRQYLAPVLDSAIT